MQAGDPVLFPGAMQRVTLLRRTGIVPYSEFGTAPDQQRTAIALRSIRGTTGLGPREGDTERLMPLERHQRSHRHIHRPQLRRAAKVRQIDDETRRDHFGADLAQ